MSCRGSHWWCALAVVLVGASLAPVWDARAQTPPAAPAPPPSQRGRITGRVVDVATGQPLAGVLLSIVGQTVGARTDLDGRYTMSGVPFGRYSVAARRIGYQAKQFDNVVVSTTDATIVNFSIGTAAVELQSVVVRSSATDRSASQTSLLAAQQKAASASDGISAEQIKRTPDSNAGEAATRVSGISIVDGKYLVARGLSERYSTTLLNGAEVTSPEPAKKIVPLDIFPASLLESIIVTKSATPDKPGDFSGGAVEIKTKEFPENTIRQFTVSQALNSQSTFRTLPFPSRHGLDFIGLDNGRREPPPLPRDSAFADPFAVERYAEGIRNDWAPKPIRTLPNLGLGMTLGGQRPSDRFALGYVLSLTYSAGSEYQADRFFRFFVDPKAEANRAFVYQDHRNNTDWGGVANVSLRLGGATKLSWKNLYTRNAEELYSTGEGFSTDQNGDSRLFQFQYIERDLLQTQLVGEHLFRWLASSRLEWKATLSESGRNEPDNRQVSYIRPVGGRYGVSANSDLWFRKLNDRQTAMQVDWQIPFRIFSTPVAFKTGGMKRAKQRAFDAALVSFNPRMAIPDDLSFLPPELLFTPENIGGFLGLTFPGTVAQPYDADDNLTAAYAMVDLTMASRIRLVAGARMEDWSLDLFDGGRANFAQGDSSRPPTVRRQKDILPSANATLSITDRINLRLAAFQSVARPDTRELSRDEYVEVAGSCSTIGTPTLQRSTITNADARLEWYPRAGEVIALSGFFKDFQNPIIRIVQGRNGCTYLYENAQSARNFGAELDLRQDLTYLPGALSRLSASMNLTYVKSNVIMAPTFGAYDPDLALEGQSPYLVNTSLAYRSAGGGFSMTVLYNRFGERIVRYGFRSSDGVNAAQGPNIVERGRGTLDAKLQQAIGRRVTISLSGRNLTNATVRFVQQVATGNESSGFSKPGYILQLGASLAR